MDQPIYKDYPIYQGNAWTRILRWRLDGVLANLTGWTARMDVRTEQDTASPLLFSLTMGDGISIDVSQGEITRYISPARTLLLDRLATFYDLKGAPPGGADPIYLMTGRLIRTKRVTP